MTLSHFAGAFLQSWLSMKHRTDFALADSRNASRHRCEEVCRCLPPSHLQVPLLAASPKAWTLVCADGDGTAWEAGELLHHHKHEAEENCKKLKKDSVFPTAKEQSGKNFKMCALCLKYLQKGSFKKLKLKRFICPSKNFKAGTTSPCSPRKEPIAYQE